MKNSVFCKDIEVKNFIQFIELLIVYNRGRYIYLLRIYLILLVCVILF